MNPLRWCPRCNARLRVLTTDDCPTCGLPAESFARVEQMRREYLDMVAELTAAHRAAVEALVNRED